uniref:Uncharacterized protein n=1 Tax=Parascaris univalens TaxID=6257 RepID=A0A915A3C8_PARUN
MVQPDNWPSLGKYRRKGHLRLKGKEGEQRRKSHSSTTEEESTPDGSTDNDGDKLLTQDEVERGLAVSKMESKISVSEFNDHYFRIGLSFLLCFRPYLLDLWVLKWTDVPADIRCRQGNRHYAHSTSISPGNDKPPSPLSSPTILFVSLNAVLLGTKRGEKLQKRCTDPETALTMPNSKAT